MLTFQRLSATKRFRGALMGSAAAVFATSVAGVGSAAAQDDDGAGESNGALDTVVVTAQKRAQNVQDVGIAIDAFSGESLQEVGVESVKDVARIVPNVDVFSVFGDGQLPVWEIRGVGLQDFNSNNTPAAALYFDEIYQSSPANGVKGLFDVDSIEILKGPQGGLYGRNTISGAVVVTSKKPEIGAGFSGDILGSYGRWDRIDVEGGVNVPLGDKAAARISTKVVQSSDKFQRSVSEDEGHGAENAESIRLQVLFEPSSNVSFLLKAEYGNNESETALGRAIPVFTAGGSTFNGGTSTFCPSFAADANSDFTECYFADGVLGASVLSDDVNEVYGDTFGALDAESFDVTGRLDWELGGGLTLTSITGYLHFDYGIEYDFDGLPGERVHYDSANNIEQFSQEIRLASDPYEEGLIWLLGAYFGKDNYTEDRPILVGDTLGVLFSDPNLALTAAYDQDTTSYAVFGQAEYPLADSIKVVGSLRYTNETKTFFNRSDTALSGTSQSGQLPDIDLSVVSGKIGLEWTPVDDALVYASFSRGFKSGGRFGGIPTFPGAVSAYSEEINHAYEIGFKSRFADDRVQLNGAIFYYDYRDAQATGSEGTSVGGAVSNLILTNIGDLEYLGGELALDFQPTDRFFFRAGVGYIDAEVSDSNNVFRDSITGEFVEFEGRPVTGVSDLTYNLLGRYTQPLANDYELTLQADHSFKAENTLRTPGDALVSQNFQTADAVALTNVRIALNSNSNWTLGANVTNVFNNRDVIRRTFDAVDGYIELYTPPRTWSIDVGYSF